MFTSPIPTDRDASRPDTCTSTFCVNRPADGLPRGIAHCEPCQVRALLVDHADALAQVAHWRGVAQHWSALVVAAMRAKDDDAIARRLRGQREAIDNLTDAARREDAIFALLRDWTFPTSDGRGDVATWSAVVDSRYGTVV